MDLTGKVIYLAAPFGQWLESETGLISAKRQEILSGLRESLIAEGANVYSPHYNEGWGRNWLSPDESVHADFRAIQQADGLVAIIGAPASIGVAIEVGWASALGIYTLIIISPHEPVAPLLHGLPSLGRCRKVIEPPDWTAVTIAEIVVEIKSLLNG
jgi:nucleoside 2-deoxyribosyltransferase